MTHANLYASNLSPEYLRTDLSCAAVVSVHEFPRCTSQARVPSSSHEPSSSQGPTFIFLFFFLMSSGCYSLSNNDVLVINGKKLTFRFATFLFIVC